MTGGFPVTPTGSPGAIESLAVSLGAANTGFEGAASALRQTASGLGGIDWSGEAEARFSVAAHGLAQAASTYHATLAGSSSHPVPSLGGTPLFDNNAGTGGGLLGGGFGVPPGGLGELSGIVPWDEVGDMDGLAKNAWLDLHGQTEVDDLDHLIDGVLIVTGVGGLAKLGFSLARSAARRLAAKAAASGLEREAAERALTPAERLAKQAADREDALKFYVEKSATTAGKLGVPYIGDAAELLGVATLRGNRIYINVRVQQALAKIAALRGSAREGIAILRSTAALHRGVRRGIPPDVIARLERIGERSGQ